MQLLHAGLSEEDLSCKGFGVLLGLRALSVDEHLKDLGLGFRAAGV